MFKETDIKPFPSKVWERLYNRDSKDIGNKRILGLSVFIEFDFSKKGSKENAYHGRLDCFY